MTSDEAHTDNKDAYKVDAKTRQTEERVRTGNGQIQKSEEKWKKKIYDQKNAKKK